MRAASPKPDKERAAEQTWPIPCINEQAAYDSLPGSRATVTLRSVRRGSCFP